jgi:D-sedoheptulose 7-phosphate isomerase
MNTYQDIIENYIDDLKTVLDQLSRPDLLAIIEALSKARRDDKNIFICGNGGSASTANHMVCDLSKNTRGEDTKRLKVIGLTDNIPTMTAYANDEGYDRIFAEPILSLTQPGDVLLAISGSGNSPNVLRGVEAANQMGARTIGLTGFEGGQLKDLVDLCLIVPYNSLEQIEDVHLIINHILTVSLSQDMVITN